MNSKIAIILVILASCIDLGLNILLTYLSTKGHFVEQLKAYSFGHSLFDLIILSYLRFCLVSGTIAYIVARKERGLKELANIKRIVLNFCVILCVFVAIKLLYFAEDSKKLLSGSFPTKALFTISGLANPLLYCQWWSIKNLSFQKSEMNYLNVQEGSSDESESLLSGSAESDTESISEDEQTEGKPKKSKKPTGSVVMKLLRYSVPDIGYIVLGFTFLIAAAVCEVFLPYFSSQIINAVAIIRSDKLFKKYIILMAVISIIASTASALRAGTFTYVMARFTVRLQNQLFAHIMKQEIGFFDKKKTGSIISRLTSDTTKVGDQISLNINILLRSLVKICGILVFMAKLSWNLTIVTLVGTPIIVMIAEAYGNYYEEISKKVQDSLALANVDAQESIASVRTIRSFAAEEIETRRYSSKLGDVFKLKIKEAIASGGFHLTTELCFLAMECLVLFYGGHLVMQGDLSGGNLVAFSFFSFDLGGNIQDISDVYTSLMEAVGASRKVFAYLERAPRILNDGTLKPPVFRGSIEFRNTSFSYPSRPDIPVLENVSFKVNRGEIVALVGPSGGGKSTVVKLLEHFYEPQFGEVLVDGIPVKEFNHVYIHNKMTLVAQEPVLFARSITENITYGLNMFDKDEVEEAAKHANAHCFITRLPEGYETQTGEKGVQLSGGQKQRVAIARALIRNPSILILDEATSALDSESEFQVQEAINSNLLNRTVLVIAHRLSTIERADKILVIDKGRLLEQGTHAELITKGGTYSRLVEKQLLGKATGRDSNNSENDHSLVSSTSSSTSSSPPNSPPKSFKSIGSLPRVGFMKK